MIEVGLFILGGLIGYIIRYFQMKIKWKKRGKCNHEWVLISAENKISNYKCSKCGMPKQVTKLK